MNAAPMQYERVRRAVDGDISSPQSGATTHGHQAQGWTLRRRLAHDQLELVPQWSEQHERGIHAALRAAMIFRS
jgi:hypothetical protein